MSAILDAVVGYRSGQRSRIRQQRIRQQKNNVEAIEMQERRHGYFPQVFIWRGTRYDVRAVERCWTVKQSGWRGDVAQHRFRVCCDYGPVHNRREGAFEIYQDVQHNTWHILKASGQRQR